MRAWKQIAQEVFLPLSHPPGEAQVDFGEADDPAGRPVETKVALFVMTLPYSDAIFVQAFPRECTETFLEGHRRAFEFFGGVPQADQLRQLGDRRDRGPPGPRAEADQRVSAAAEPLPVPGALLPGAAAQREGARRAAVGLRPAELPGAGAARSIRCETLNEQLRQRCQADLDARTRGKPGPKSELLAEDQAAFLPLPKQAFEARRVDAGDGRFAVAGAVRHQRLFGAGAVRPSAS